MAGDRKKYAGTQWTRYTAQEMKCDCGGSKDDIRRTWRARLPDGTILTSSYAYLPKDAKTALPGFNIIILDEADRRVAQTLTNYRSDNLVMNNLSLDSIWHLHSMFHFNERMGRQKKLYWRVIPEIDLGNDVRGPEEARILTEGLWEILYTVKTIQGEILNTDNVGVLEVKYNKIARENSQFHTIPLSELEKVLDMFDIDKSMITLIDDPMHILSERESFKHGNPVKTYSLTGDPIMSLNQAALFFTQSMICGVDWKTTTLEERKAIWNYIYSALREVKSEDNYILYSLILKQIVLYKSTYPAIHVEQTLLKIYLLQNENPGVYLRTPSEYTEYAILFGYPPDVFDNRNTQVWQLRVQGVFAAIQFFTEGVEGSGFLDLLIRDAMMFFIHPAHKRTYRGFYDEKEIFDLDEDGDERCRTIYKLENKDYEFHFHNKHTIRGTRSRRKLVKYFPKMTAYVISDCARKPDSEDVTSSEKPKNKFRRRCRQCRASLYQLEERRKQRHRQLNSIHSFARFEKERMKTLFRQEKLIRVQKRSLEERERMRTMPMDNERMEFEINTYKISLPLLEMETREEQEKCEELYKRNQELRLEEARLISQLEVEDILQVCFNQQNGRKLGLNIHGSDQPLWVPGLLDDSDLDIDRDSSGKKEKVIESVHRRKSQKGKYGKKKRCEKEMNYDRQIEKFVEKEWSGWCQREDGIGEKGKKVEKEERDDSPIRRSKKSKTPSSKSVKLPEVQHKTLLKSGKFEGLLNHKFAGIVEKSVEVIDEETDDDQMENTVDEKQEEDHVFHDGIVEFEVEIEADNEDEDLQNTLIAAVDQKLKVSEADDTFLNEKVHLEVSHIVAAQKVDGLSTVTTIDEPVDQKSLEVSQETIESSVDNLMDDDFEAQIQLVDQKVSVDEKTSVGITEKAENEPGKDEKFPSEDKLESEEDLAFVKETEIEEEEFPEASDSKIEPEKSEEQSKESQLEEEVFETTVTSSQLLDQNLQSTSSIDTEAKSNEENTFRNLNLAGSATSEQLVLDVVEGLLAPFKLSEGLEDVQESKEEDGSSTVAGTEDQQDLRDPSVDQKSSSAPNTKEGCSSDFSEYQKENQTPTVITVTTVAVTDAFQSESHLEQPCSSSSSSSSSSSVNFFKKPMEPIPLNFMEHQGDPGLLIQQLLNKDSDKRPSRIRVDVQNKEIDHSDLTSPSSVPEDPATSLKTLKMLSNQKPSTSLSFDYFLQTQGSLQEKDRRIEELETLCRELLDKNEQLESQLSQNQASTSTTSTEDQLKLELQEKDSKISDLESSNRELELKIKHQEEFIDKLLKR